MRHATMPVSIGYLAHPTRLNRKCLVTPRENIKAIERAVQQHSIEQHVAFADRHPHERRAVLSYSVSVATRVANDGSPRHGYSNRAINLPQIEDSDIRQKARSKGLFIMKTPDVSALWVSCNSSRSVSYLLAEVRRFSALQECGPSEAVRMLADAPRIAAFFEFDDPDHTHLQLLQSIKRRFPGIPLVMITEAHSEELAVWAFRARLWNYLVKPVPLRELKANFRQLTAIAAQRSLTDIRSVERPAALLPGSPLGPASVCSEAHIMKRAAEHIHDNYTERLSIEKLAGEFGMNRFCFSRLFQRTYGCSYRDYVTRLRIERACKILTTSRVSVTEAAGKSGFADPSYLARMFRRHLGKSPRQYCEEHAHGEPLQDFS